MGEEWRGVPGWPRYEVSDIGRVKRRAGVGRRFTRLLSPKFSPKGYMRVTLCSGGVAKGFTLQRVVALAFLGPAPSSRHEVAHLDGVKANCAATNLAWKTPKEDAMDKWLHGTQPVKHSREVVAAMRCLFEGGFSRKAIARVLAIGNSTVRDVVNGVSRVHG